MSREGVLEKIRKMLALAEGTTTNANEAANAAAMAQRLMLQHKIERAEVEVDAATEKIEVVTEEAAKWGRPFHWDSALLAAVAKSNLCEAVLKRIEGGAKVAMLIGERGSVQTVRYVYAYLRNEVTSIAAKEAGGPRHANAFKLGMVIAIGARLISQMKATASGGDGETALVIVNREREAVSDYMAEHFAHVKDRHVRTRVSDANAFGRGVARGREVALPGKVKHIASAPARIGGRP